MASLAAVPLRLTDPQPSLPSVAALRKVDNLPPSATSRQHRRRHAAADREKKSPLPGTKRKQADALAKNIGWLAETFGPERIGFVTLTVGDLETGGKFRNLRDRREAQRRFHSFLTNELSKRYQCGVVVMERHKNGGIHFHLAVVTRENIRGNIDFDACFPAKDHLGKTARKPDFHQNECRGVKTVD